MWGMIPLLIEQHATGTAYGLLTSFQNIGTAITPFFISAIHDATNSHEWVSITFIILACFGFFIKIWLYQWDKLRRGNLLQSKNPAQLYSDYLKNQKNDSI